MLLFYLSTPAVADILVWDIDLDPNIDVSPLWFNENDTNGDNLINRGEATEETWLNALLGQAVGDCIFRTIPAADSGRSRPPIPIDSGHRFRTKPATHSGAFRPPHFLKFHS
jgi:hypothetical protein